MTWNKNDVLVVGGGPGGFDAALACASMGLKTTLVERDQLGGTCLNWGCIPTKLFLGASEGLEELSSQTKFKIFEKTAPPRFSLSALQKKKSRVLSATQKAMAKQLADAGIKIIQGSGQLDGADSLLVAGTEGMESIPFGDLILATGSRPTVLPGLEPDNESILDSNMLLGLEEPPRSLLIIGGGVIGLEMAEFMHRLGVEITIVEALDRLAPAEDPEVCAALASFHKRRGWKLFLEKRVESLDRSPDGALVRLDSGENLAADKVLVATGRSPNTNGLGLMTVGAEVCGPGWIVADEQLRAAPNIYAVGDVNGRIMLAHAASQQGEYVARVIAGKETGPYAPGAMPSCIYGTCEVVRAGEMAGEVAARNEDQGDEPVLVSRSMLAANPMAQAHAMTHGFVKVVWRGGKVRGVTAVGHRVSHLATLASVICRKGWTREDVENTVFAHPTLDESLKQALLAEPAPE